MFQKEKTCLPTKRQYLSIFKIRKQDLNQTGSGLPAYMCVFKFKFQ